MSEVKVNKISPRAACGTTTLGDSGDTFTIPSGVSITNLGTASGFGATGETSWVTTVKTATFTATAGEGYFCDTTSGVFTVNLPAGAAGASVAVADYAGTFDSNALTISPNGTEKIGGVNSDVTLSSEGQSATFVYVDSTQGWVNVIDSTSNIRGIPFVVATGGTESTSGNCKIHTFTSPGTFTVTNIASACAALNLVSYLVVAGGGGGGKGNAGGGGAGGFREVKSPLTPYTASPLDGYPSSPNRVTVAATAYPITVGAGGAIQTNPYSEGNVGSNSIFSTITSAGGGYGGAYQDNGQNGGSGGGAGADCTTGGTGNTPPTTPAQGQNGGNGAGPICGAGGGGGAGAAGSPPSPNNYGGPGGAGVTTEISASPVQRAGGGGAWGRPGPGGSGGAGGGGAGGNNDSGAAGSGTVNTGSGGGGTGNPAPTTGGGGGSGIVIIRYKFQ